MNKGFLIALGGGLGVAALLFTGVGFWRGGDRVAPSGSILKVRSVAAEERHSLVVMDVRIANRSNVALEARQVSVTLETKGGQALEGTLVSGVDAKQLFRYYPALGEAYNDPLIAGSRVPPHKTEDFMIAARLDVPEPELSSRRKLTVTLQDRTGALAVLREEPR